MPKPMPKAVLFDNETGRALPALYEMKSFLDTSTAIIPFLQEGMGEATFSGDWYSLQGIRLAGKPSQDGLYIRGSQKVFIHH